MIDCTACHRRTGERAFSDTPTDCYSCHKTEFHAITIHPIHDGSGGQAMFPRDCGRCHRTSAWTPAVADPNMLPRSAMIARVDHDTAFVLSTGAHRTADCAACHVDRQRTKLVRCDGCHQDAALRAQHRAPVARSASACLGCHPRGAAR